MAGGKSKQQHVSNSYSYASQDNDNDPETECGIGRFRPAALKMAANMTVFTGVYSVCGLLSSTLSSYVNSQVTTLERHFGFNSSQTGLIMAANDIGFLAVVLLVSYVATKVHIPRALGLVTILFGVSGIICAVPQFLYGMPTPVIATATSANSSSSSLTLEKLSKSVTGQICDGINDTLPGCDLSVNMTGYSMPASRDSDRGSSARSNSNAALVIIVVGMMLQGVAKTPRSSFVTTYVDANVEKTQTGFYMGIIITLGIMGPAVAYAIGSVFTRIYVTLEETDMDFKHPHWVGAWWLGYIVFGCAACLFAIPLFCFPSRMKKQDKPDKHQENASAHHKKMSPKTALIFIKGFASSMMRLLMNPIYVCMVLSSCVYIFSVSGSSSFNPKYIENQFSYPAWKANMTIAGTTLCSACLGTFLGGYMSKRLRMGPLASLKWVVFMQTMTVIFMGIKIAFKCDQPYLYNSPGPRATAETTISGCHDACACDDNDYFPVCGDDGRTFFSPCHAGCMHSLGTSYANCSCIAGGTAVAGMCDYGCSMIIPFVIFECLGNLCGTFSIVPKIIIYIRSVETRDKPMALGFIAFMSSLIGWMLGPIVFGWLIDGICIQWELACTSSGACRLYDNDILRIKLLGYQAAFRLLGATFSGSALIVAIVTKKFENSQDPAANEVSMSLMTAEKVDPKATEKTNGMP